VETLILSFLWLLDRGNHELYFSYPFQKREYASERELPNMTTSESIAKIKTFKIVPVNPVPAPEPCVRTAICFYDLPIPKCFSRRAKQLASLLIKTVTEK